MSLKSRSTFDAGNLHRSMTCCAVIFFFLTECILSFLWGVLIEDLKIPTKSAYFLLSLIKIALVI